MSERPQVPLYTSRPRCEEISPGRRLYRAPAKINLTLRVGPPRADGYHPLDSLAAKVTLYDELVIEPDGSGAIEFACASADVGAPEKNLALRAARLLHELAPSRGARIELVKHIPVGAGLGGGSSDAAAVLAALNELWQLHLSQERLAELGAALGSDVPLFLGPPATRMAGRGEILTPVAIQPFAAILCCPPVHSGTGAVYRAYDEMSPAPLEPADLDAFAHRPASQWRPLLRNDLYAPACRVNPAIADWAGRLAQQLGHSSHMTGSGSALFALFDSSAQAAEAALRLDAPLAAVSRIVTGNPW